MKDDYERLIERFDALREADREAVRLAHDNLTARLEGFPQQFATKDEMQAALRGLQRLDKDAVTREIYEANLEALRTLVLKLERQALLKAEFEVFAANYRAEQERNVADRHRVVEALSEATEKVRAQVAEERSEYITHEYYEREHRALEREILAVQRWQYKLVGGLVFATFVAPLVTAGIVYALTGR